MSKKQRNPATQARDNLTPIRAQLTETKTELAQLNNAIRQHATTPGGCPPHTRKIRHSSA